MTETPAEIPYVLPEPGPCKLFPGQMCISCQFVDQPQPVETLYLSGCLCPLCHAFYAKPKQEGTP